MVGVVRIPNKEYTGGTMGINGVWVTFAIIADFSGFRIIVGRIYKDNARAIDNVLQKPLFESNKVEESFYSKPVTAASCKLQSSLNLSAHGTGYHLNPMLEDNADQLIFKAFKKLELLLV
jgi:hypothetical protein